MKTGVKKRGISYARVSTMGQLHRQDGSRIEDSSPEAQKLRCTEYLKHLQQRRNGIAHEIVEHISDEGFSGKNTNRPGFQRLWNLVEQKKINFVIATELSRISRSVVDFLEFIQHCERHDVDVYIIGLDFDTASPTGRVMLTMLVGLAQFEREMTSQRVKENAHIKLLKDGKINGASEILGLKRDPNKRGHFLPDEIELKNVAEILKLFLKLPSRTATFSEIVTRGIRGSSGRPFTMRMLEGILENVSWRYRGLWCVNEENKEIDPSLLPESKQYQIVKLPHGRVLDEHLLNDVQKKLDTAAASRKKSGRDGYVYLLSSILKTHDGLKLSGYSAKSGQYRYYKNSRSKIRIDADDIHRVITNRMKVYFRNSVHLRKLVEESIRRRNAELPSLESEMKRVESEIAQIERSRAQLSEHLLEPTKAGDLQFLTFIQKQDAELLGRVHKLKSEMLAMESIKEDVTAQVGLKDIENLLEEFNKDFDQLTAVQKRSYIERIFKEIVVHPDNQIELKLYEQPPSLSVTWRKKRMEWQVNGGAEGTRTLDLLRDRQAF